MDLGGWTVLGNWMFVEADEEGHASRVCCGHGGGMQEVFDRCFDAAEVLFDANGARAYIEDHTYRQGPLGELLKILTEHRKPPKGYQLPADKPLDWRQVHEEDGRRLYRYTNGVMAWVEGTEKSIVEGADAEDLDVQYGYLFSAQDRQKLEQALVPGVDAVATMQSLFDGRLKEIGRYQTQGDWHLADGGVVHLKYTADGKLESLELRERGDAYVTLRS